MTREAIKTAAAPGAIGTYSQAVRCGGTVYLSGQIGLDPATMKLVDGIEAQIHRALSGARRTGRREPAAGRAGGSRCDPAARSKRVSGER